jgi:hypothetical protein
MSRFDRDAKLGNPCTAGSESWYQWSQLGLSVVDAPLALGIPGLSCLR